MIQSEEDEEMLASPSPKRAHSSGSDSDMATRVRRQRCTCILEMTPDSADMDRQATAPQDGDAWHRLRHLDGELAANSRTRSSVLHGKSSGEPVAETIHEDMGGDRDGDEARGALLCLRPLLPQADSHLDEHGVGTEGQHRHGALREQMQGREAGARALGAPVQDCSGELAGKKRVRQEGSQEYDAREAASRTTGGSDHAQRKRCRQEGGAGGGVQGGELEAEETEDEVDWQGEFEPGIS